MANTILQLTRKKIRQAVLNLVNGLSQYDVIVATASGGGDNYITVPRLRAVPTNASEKFVGANVYITDGTGVGQSSYITAFEPSSGSITIFPLFESPLVPADDTSVVEIYSRWSKEQVDNAIDMAFWDGSSRYLVPSESVSSAFESAFTNARTSYPVSTARQLFRSEYPIPSQFLWLSQVDYDENMPILSWPSCNWTGDGVFLQSVDNPINANILATPRTVLGQGFTVTADQWISYASLFLYQPYGFKNDDMQVWIYDVTSGATVAYSLTRSSDDVLLSPSLVVFPLAHPVKLTSGRSYILFLQAVDRTTHAAIVSSTAVGSTERAPAIYWAIDNTGGNSTQTTGGYSYYGKYVVSVSPLSVPWQDEAFSYLFYLYDRPSWKPFNHTHWSVIPSDNYSYQEPAQSSHTNLGPVFTVPPSPKIHFDDGLVYAQDGTMFRLRGARGAIDFSSTSGTVTESSIPEIDPSFIIYKAASTLAMTRMPAPGMSPDQLQLQAQVWDSSAERHRQPYQIPPGALRRVR